MNKIGVALAVVIILTAAAWISSIPHGSDEEQIRAVVAKASASVRQQNIGQMMSCLSPDFTSELGDYDATRVVLLSFFRNVKTVDVAVASPTIKITGPTATAESAIRASWTSNGESTTDVSSHLSVELRRENHKAYLVFPRREWRILTGRVSSPIPGLE
ncbi:MAG: hypothetical protein WCL39_12015 [Armatimonadota bacterium]